MPSVRRRTGEGDDEEFEILDVSRRAWVRDLFKDVSKGSAATQLAVGGGTGWCTGYLFGKVGKAAAAALGGSLLILQIAHHQGYIKINWQQVETNMDKARKQFEKRANKDLPAIASEKLDQFEQFLGIKEETRTEKAVRKVSEIVRDNVFLAGGFTAGFFLGLAT